MTDTKCPETGLDPDVIYLSPRCWEGSFDGREWCRDAQEPCPDCGLDWVKFVRADIDAALQTEAGALEDYRRAVLAACDGRTVTSIDGKESRPYIAPEIKEKIRRIPLPAGDAALRAEIARLGERMAVMVKERERLQNALAEIVKILRAIPENYSE